MAAGFSSLAAPLDPGGLWGNTAFHAVVGGVASILGGGKFADGAFTGAFVYLFSHAAGWDPNKQHKSTRQIYAEAKALAESIAVEIRAKPDYDLREYGAVIHFDDDGNIVASDVLPGPIPEPGQKMTMGTVLNREMRKIGYDRVIATAHSHPGNWPVPSRGDRGHIRGVLLNKRGRGEEYVHGYIITKTGVDAYCPLGEFSLETGIC